MKKQFLIVSVTVAAMLIGLGSLTFAQNGVVAQVPGNTVVQDAEGDLLLKKCPDTDCSIPSNAPPSLPKWFDIKTAKITQIGGGRVDLSMALFEPIPETPPVPFVAYLWVFDNVCDDNPPTDKLFLRVLWIGGKWSANWGEIVDCEPLTWVEGDPVPFQFTKDGVKVQVELSDLLTGEGSPLLWHAAVRAVPGSLPYPTLPVDVAPDIPQEESAIWMPR